MATINTRAKSPTRAEAIAKALRPGPVFCTGVLLGNWVEDRIECPKGGTFYFPPKDIDYNKLKPESRQPDFRLNKLNSLQGSVHSVIRHDSHDACGNFATTTDVVYNHLPKPLCGPDMRYYKRSAHQFYPQPDLMRCFISNEQTVHLLARNIRVVRNAFVTGMGRNAVYPCYTRGKDDSLTLIWRWYRGDVTEWGLKKYLQHEWACTDVSDYSSSLYEDTYVPPMPHQYLQRCERNARNSSFTKSFHYKMTKSKQ